MCQQRARECGPLVFGAPLRRIGAGGRLPGAHLESRASGANSNNEHESPKARKPAKAKGPMGRPFEQISAEIIGAALAVHKELGPGFLESIYHAAMRVSLAHRSIPFKSQFPVDVFLL